MKQNAATVFLVLELGRFLAETTDHVASTLSSVYLAPLHCCDFAGKSVECVWITVDAPGFWVRVGDDTRRNTRSLTPQALYKLA
jgi:hypothetical protein